MSTNLRPTSFGAGPPRTFNKPTRSPAVYAVVSVTLWVLFGISCIVSGLTALTILGHPLVTLRLVVMSQPPSRYRSLRYWRVVARAVNLFMVFVWLTQFATNREHAQANDHWLPLVWVVLHLAMAGYLYGLLLATPRDHFGAPNEENCAEAQPPVPFLHNVPVVKVEQPHPPAGSPTATSTASNTYAIPIRAFEMVMASSTMPSKPVEKGTRRRLQFAPSPTQRAPPLDPEAGLPSNAAHINLYFTENSVPELHGSPRHGTSAELQDVDIASSALGKPEGAGDASSPKDDLTFSTDDSVEVAVRPPDHEPR